MASWNELELKPPPTVTCKMTTSQVSFSDLRKISDACWNALTLLKNQETLFSEAATLSRLIHRMRSMFRGDKGFKSIQKLHQCLRHFLALNLIPIYESFFRTIPWDCSEKEIYCPTRQMLEYVLLRTQGFAALLSKIVHTCLEAASLFKSRMSVGHNWQISLLCLGAVSRIWSLSKYLLNSCINWYDIMLPYLEKFQPKGPLWLSENHVFPPDLTRWLSLPWMDTSEAQDESHMDFNYQIHENLNMVTNEEVLAFTGHMNPKIMSIHDDVGVTISRASILQSETPQKGFCNEVIAKRPQKTQVNIHDDVGVSISRSSTSTTQEAIENETISKSRKKIKQKNSSLIIKREIDSSPKKQSKKNECKNKNVMSLISSIQSQSDVDALLLSEAKQRSLTSSLNKQQWKLLKNLVSKLNLKLKKVHEEKKRQQLLEQIRKAFQIALS